MPTLLWLDDERNPSDPRWQSFFAVESPAIIWVKNYREFTEWIAENSLPDAICFDHDLGPGPSGLDAAKWLISYCIKMELDLPKWSIQSANPVGKRNIHSLLDSFERFNGDS